MAASCKHCENYRERHRTTVSRRCDCGRPYYDYTVGKRCPCGKKYKPLGLTEVKRVEYAIHELRHKLKRLKQKLRKLCP